MNSAAEQIHLKDLCYALSVAALGPATRGMQNILPTVQDDLYYAAQSIAATPGSRIAIVTGFRINRADPPQPENDGPVGAVHLAGLLADCGYDVEVITDQYCVHAVLVAREAASLDIQVKSISDEETIRKLAKRWAASDDAPTHVIAIERAGPSIDGTVRDMRGADITATNAPLNALFEPPKSERPYVTIGIGDGGNEIGMGKIATETISANVSLGALIHCKTPCDFLVPAGVSNWGAGALAAAVSLLRPNSLRFLGPRYNVDTDMLIMRALARAGVAVDGVTGAVSPNTVDGLTEKVNHEVIRSILRIALLQKAAEGPKQ